MSIFLSVCDILLIKNNLKIIYNINIGSFKMKHIYLIETLYLNYFFMFTGIWFDCSVFYTCSIFFV